MPEFHGNPEHLEIVQNGRISIQSWREKHRYEVLDLRGAHLSNALLFDVKFGYVNLNHSKLRRIVLSDSNLSYAKLARADLTGANLARAVLNNAILIDADLSRAHLSQTHLRGAHLDHADLRGTYLFRADLSQADLSGANLSKAYISRVNLSRADCRYANFSDTDLTDSNLSRSNFTNTILNRTNLTNANLTDVNLSNAYINRANLTNANLKGADLQNTIFSGVSLDKVNFDKVVLLNTVFMQSNLSQAKNLKNCIHHGPSSIDYQTLLVANPLPIEFLRGCGFPDDYIDYLPQLFKQPLHYYSLFISYSTKDERFAQKLYTDLQNQGIRCWYAPKHMKPGKKQYEQITNAIQLNDRLLLILSPSSMESKWVKTEISEARHREEKEKRNILIPIRLVSMEIINKWECFDADLGWDSAKEIREYHIEDFENWHEESVYQQSLQKLIQSLKKEMPPPILSHPPVNF